MAHEGVLSQRLVHATHPSSADSILSEQFLRGGSATRYDTVLFTEPDAPRSLFAEIRPESEGTIFPYSFYPKDLPILGDVSILTVNMDVLCSPKFRMFYHKTSPTQFGPSSMTSAALSQVIFVHAQNSRALAFARKHFLEIDKRANRILTYVDEPEQEGRSWTFATRVLDPERRVVRRHSVVVVILEGLTLDDVTKVERIAGRRTGMVRFSCVCMYRNDRYVQSGHMYLFSRFYFTKLSTHRGFAMCVGLEILATKYGCMFDCFEYYTEGRCRKI